jgi:hypothetical protein
MEVHLANGVCCQAAYHTGEQGSGNVWNSNWMTIVTDKNHETLRKLSLTLRCSLNKLYSYVLYHVYAEHIAENKLRGLSPRANYTYRAAAACRRSG